MIGNAGILCVPIGQLRRWQTQRPVALRSSSFSGRQNLLGVQHQCTHLNAGMCLQALAYHTYVLIKRDDVIRADIALSSKQAPKVPIARRGKPPTSGVCLRNAGASRRRLAGKGPSLRIPLKVGSDRVIVHHIWFALDGNNTSGPNDLQLACLRSWGAHTQVLWTWAHVDVRLPGLVRGDLESVFPITKATWMVRGGVPPQMVKDVLEMLILHKYGGLYTDLDIYSLGQPPPISAEGFLFSLEPKRREPGTPFGRKDPSISLACCAFPCGHDGALLLAEDFEGRWVQHATRSYQSGNCREPLAASKWMDNTRIFTLHVLEHPAKRAATQLPIVLQPLAKWSKEPPPAEHDVALPTWGHIEAGLYHNPSQSQMLHHTICINLWERQWPDTLKRSILQLAHSLHQATAPGNVEAVATEGDRKLEDVRTLCKNALQGLAAHVGEPASYHIVGSSLRLLEEDWCADFILQTRYQIETCAGAVMAIALSTEPSVPAHITREANSLDIVAAPAFASAEHFLLRVGGAEPATTKTIMIGMLTAMARRPM